MVVKNLAPGSYIVTFSNTGYETLRAEISVSKEGLIGCVKVEGGGSCDSLAPGSVKITGTLSALGTLKPIGVPPVNGYLSVSSTPSGASIDVNGMSIGKTPVTGYELATGSKLVTLRLSGYTPEERSVTITDGETATIDVTLSPLPVEEEGFLFVTSVPSGANVSIGGISIGTTPIDNYGLPAGSKTVTISMSGYETATRAVTIVAGETATIDVTLVEEVTTIGGWIDEVNVSALNRDHWMYVYNITIGATGAADALYATLSPKPSPINPILATRDNWMGLYNYSIGAMAAGNALTGCNY